MNRNFHLFIILLLSAVHLNAQQYLSEKATVSVITCGPSTSELYSTFGHSAFRVFDPLSGIDTAYNYGVFDFNAPNFYFNFAKGKMTYQLSATNFSRFLRIYQHENRWVKAQVLDLSPAEVQEVYNYLETNAMPENKYYQYDFFYDNCSTKIEDVLKSVLKEKIIFDNTHITTHKSHRDLIDDYTHQFKWGKFGIDLALGSVIDDKASKDEYKFLPDYIFKAVRTAELISETNHKPLIKNELNLLTSSENSTSSNNLFISPFIIILIVSLFIIMITYRNFIQWNRSKWLDFILNIVTGLIGMVVLLLWFATTHTATYKNFNFLWAFAPNLIIAFFMFRRKLPNWISAYNKLLILLLFCLGILWLVGVQDFNLAIITFLLALLFRYLFLIVHLKRLS